jgi:uncharacterized protein
VSSAKPRFAVIGSGVAGVTAAQLLQDKYDITLFENNHRLGGHTNTIVLEDGPDAGTPVDTGFIVLNDQTYPLLHKLLKQWNCPVRNSDMSFGFYSEATGFYYAGTNLSGLFARRSNVLRPSFYRFLRDILRFGQQAIDDLAYDRIGNQTMRDYVAKVHPETVRNFVIPMAAAIWSATQREILDFPAASMLAFWRNHGLLALKNRPQWQTVVGGSHAYLKRFEATFNGTIRLNTSLRAIRRANDNVTLLHADGTEETFDGVVLATHADEAIALLETPTDDERRLLGPWRYQPNRTLLHTDTSFLPRNRRAWASWNYLERKNQQPDEPVPVTYWMNLLQGLRTRHDYFVTLNPAHEPAPGTLIREIQYDHPVFDLEAVATQRELASLQGTQNTWFCGSYFGHGFHEDAVRSSVQMAATHGITF